MNGDSNLKENKKYTSCINPKFIGSQVREMLERDLRDLLLIMESQFETGYRNSDLLTKDQWDQFYSFPRLLITSPKGEHSDPFVLQPSLFHDNNVPPTIYFNTEQSPKSRPPIGLPRSLQCLFRWRITSISPNSIKNCVKFMKFDTILSSDETDLNYLGSWYKHMLTAAFSKLEIWRKVNHYPGSFHLGRKDKLCYRLRLADDKFGPEEFGCFHPMTFVLPRDYEDLCSYWESSPSKLFIMKPPASARGNGIKVINDISMIPPSALEIPQFIGLPVKKSTMIVQQYISNPCLLENGQKFDLRIYVLLTSVDPLRIYVYDDGLVRFASSKYNSQEDGIIDQYMHLTNYFVNKTNQEYKINNDYESLMGSKWSLKRFWRHLDENYLHVNSRKLQQEIMDIIIKTIICCEGPMSRLSHQNCNNDYTSYELFGFDIILDENFKPWILEVNITPSLKSESDLDTQVKYGLIKDMFNIVGYNLPPLTSLADQKLLFDARLYDEHLTKKDRSKQFEYQKLFKEDPNQDLDEILSSLTQNDVRVLMLTEDELSRRGSFERIFPTESSGRYLKFFDKPRYYNLLLNAWEKKYATNRREAITRLTDTATFLDSPITNNSS